MVLRKKKTKASAKVVVKKASRPGESVARAGVRRTTKGRRIRPVGSSKVTASPVRGGAKPFPPPQKPIPELPEHFGVDRVTIMPRDPWWVYAYWELLDRSRADARKRLKDPGARLVLRVYEMSGNVFSPKNIAKFVDVPVHDTPVGQWYVNIWNEGAMYCTELGLLSKAGKFAPIARSNPINGTFGSLSEEIDEQWVTVDRDYQEMFQLKGEGADQIEHVPSSGSLPRKDVQRLLSRKLETELSSGAMAGFSSSAYPAHVADQVAREKAAAQDTFWLQVGTELILYGATEPDAEVTVMGQPIELRKDGTFTMRFHLPEGKFDLNVHGRSANKKHERSITPVVERTTR